MNACASPTCKQLTCRACRLHYGDDGPCDRGMPVASPHRAEIEANRAAEARRIATYRAAPRVTFIHNATLDGTQDDWRVVGRPEVYATEADAVAAYRAARRATETEV